MSENCQIDLGSPIVLLVEQPPPNGFCQYLCPQGNPICLLPLCEALLDQQLGVMQDPFILLPLNVLGTCEILSSF